ncbi:MAG: DUF4388 domain-containing protein [Deltaproteobacteria bacterium]|nr:DUF4388 domain-containing protein [Deltaproteobacteria bacterium]
MSRPTDAPPARILIVTSDGDFFKPWAIEARAAGFDVALALDAGRGLTRAVLSPPDVILFDSENASLPAPQFLQILRANPRTAATPFILVSNDHGSSMSQVGFRDSELKRNCGASMALEHLHGIMRRAQRVQAVSSPSVETVAGNLTQVPLPDLLQLLSSNRKSGVLTISATPLEGVIALEDGQLIAARLGEHGREKALFRMLAWTEAPFKFAPVPIPAGFGANLSGSLASLILEGLRQNDEFRRLSSRLPPDTALALTAGPLERPSDLSPAMREVLTLLEFYGSVREVLEHSLATDLDTLDALESLVTRGLVELVSPASLEKRGRGAPLLAPEEVFGLFRRLSRGLAVAPNVIQGKLLLMSDSFHPLRSLIHDLTELDGFELHRDLFIRGARRHGFGSLATLHLSDSVWLSLFAVPSTDAFIPIWRFFATGALALVVFWEGAGAPTTNPRRAVPASVPIYYARWISADAPQNVAPNPIHAALDLREDDRSSAREFIRAILARATSEPVVGQ